MVTRKHSKAPPASHPSDADSNNVADYFSRVSAPDVFRFNNPEAVRASSSLIDNDIVGTLHRAACVLDFLSGCKDYGESGGAGENAQFGFHLILKYVGDGLEKQAEALSPTRGETSDV